MANQTPTPTLIERMQYWQREVIGYRLQERSTLIQLLKDAEAAIESAQVKETRALIHGTVRGYDAGENATAKHWRERAETAEAALAAQEAANHEEVQTLRDVPVSEQRLVPQPEMPQQQVVAAQEAVPHLDAVSRAMSALETGSTHEQRKAAWNGLRDAFYREPVEEAVPQPVIGIPSHICGICYHPLDKCSHCDAQPVIAREWFEKGWRALAMGPYGGDPDADDAQEIETAYLAACRLLREEKEPT